MDKKLLDALNNIGLGLEELVDAINSKKEAKSSTATAIQSGDFSKDLKSISESIKSIKADTQTIIKNQQTIIAQGKEKENEKIKDFEADPKKESAIKKGVGTILLIAVAVLAIGMAFKLIGNVDVLSVIGLSLGITLVAIAFEKVAELKLGIKDAAIASAVMVIASLGLMLSSHILNLVKPVSTMKMVTAIGIAAGFAVLGPSISKIIGGIKEVGIMDLVKTVVFLPLILPVISIGIALSSQVLQYVKPISLTQFVSSILIAGIFVVLSFGIKKMVKAFDGIDPASILTAAVFLPIILISIAGAVAATSHLLSNVKMLSLGSFFGAILVSVIFVVLSYSIRNIIRAFKGIGPGTAIATSIAAPILLIALSYAIWKSSEYLNSVVPITMNKFLTSVGISIVFIGLAFAASQIIRRLKGISPSQMATAVISIPILLVAMSGAIWLSSILLDKVTVVSEEKLINAGLIGAGLAIIALAMTPTIKVLSKVGVANILKGALIIPILAATIMVSSLILDLGAYEKYPGLEWIAGVSLSLLTFGLGALALGLAVTGPQAIVFAAGLVAILGVAATIVGVSHILKKGEYENPGMLDWAKSVSLLYLTFTPLMLILGTAALASSIISVFGPNPWKMAKTAIEDVAKTIVSASVILSEGYTDKEGVRIKPNYQGGPTNQWASGISIALGAFSPIYGMLMRNAIFKIFSGGGVGPDDFTSAIKTVSKGIVTAAKFFASSENPGIWAKYPSKSWSEGVGLAIGAFAPVYEIIAANSGWFKSGVSPEDFAGKFDNSGKLVKDGAIQVIARGVISAAKFFASNDNKGVWGAHPTKKWSEGVGAALGAFAPVYDILLKNSSWFRSDVDPEDFAGKFDSSGKLVKDGAIQIIARGIVSAAKFFALNTAPFKEGSYPTEKWGKGVTIALSAFAPIFDMLKEKSGFWKSGSSVIKGMIEGIDGVSLAIVKVAVRFSAVSNKKMFDAYPDENWSKNIEKSIKLFTEISNYIDDQDAPYDETVDVANHIVTMAKVLSDNSGLFRNNITPNYISNLDRTIRLFTEISKYIENQDASYSEAESVAQRLVRMARIIHGGSEFFTSVIDPNYIKNVSKNMLDFSEMVKKLIESEDQGMLANFGNNLLGNDPIVQIAKRMITLAEGYDRLADSLIKLGSAMKVLNISDIRMLGGLTTTITSPKGESEIKKTDSTNFNFKKGQDSPMVSSFEDKGPGSFKEDMDKIVKLLTNIDKSTESLNDIAMGMDKEVDESIKIKEANN